MTAIRPAFRLIGALAASAAGPSRVARARPLLAHAVGRAIPTMTGGMKLRWHSSTSAASSDQGSSSTSLYRTTQEEEGAPTASEETLRLDAPAPGAKSQRIAQLEPRLSLTFTCTADDCGHRSTHEFAKRSYTKGIVLIQCPGCKNRHLIADNLGWFKESTEEGKLRTVEDLVRAKGERVRTGKVNFDGDVEYDPES